MFEGEEEYASATSSTWLDANRDRLAADVAVISDTGFFEGNLPAITIGLRGIDVRPDRRDGAARSTSIPGSFGGTVQNPANALAPIIAELKGPDGRVASPASTTTSCR